MKAQQIQDRLLQHIQEKYMNRVAEGIELSANTALFREGIVDSIGVLMVVQFLENEFDLTLEPDEMVLENFDSVSSLTRLVSRKMKVPE